jgi:uncharacterized membrane protein YhdT
MIQYITTFPVWFTMSMIICLMLLVICSGAAFIYRFIKYGANVKVGPLEIDATEENHAKDE